MLGDLKCVLAEGQWPTLIWKNWKQKNTIVKNVEIPLKVLEKKSFVHPVKATMLNV